jgi:hypothetical protein
MAEHLCGVEADDEGITVAIAMYEDDCDDLHRVIDPRLLCNLPAPHENPEYLLEDGTYNYVHWLCDSHWDDFLESKSIG